MVYSSKQAVFRSTYLPNQQWTLPDSLVYYIAKNPLSGKLYEKMIRSCKHFFIEKPILIIPRLLMLYCRTEISITNKWHAFLDIYYDERYDFENMPLKCWIIEYFDVQYSKSHDCKFTSEFIPNIYQCDAKELKLYRQSISFNELIFLGSKCVKIYLYECTLLNEDGTVITLEKLVEIFPNVKNFCYSGKLLDYASNIITSKTVKELIKIPHFQNFESFIMYKVPETFDIETFFEYIKTDKKTKMELHFSLFISEAYKIRLHAIVDEILATTENPTYKLPWLNFSGINQVYYQMMRELYDNNL